MKWSKIMQSPRHLKATRKAYLNEEFAELIAKYSGIQNNTFVLEVGCGTGCFSRYLSNVVSNVRFVGIDNDTHMLENGQDMIGNNSIEYIDSSAFKLPFEDNTFDAVVSHTFFNCVTEPKKAMDEMKRVVKNVKPITSITSMSLSYETWHTGEYPDNCDWRENITQLENSMLIAMEKIKLGPFSHNKGYSASYMPLFFTKSGLSKVSIFPLSRAFSLSNAAMSKEDKLEYIDNIYYGDLDRLEGAMCCNRFIEIFTLEEYHMYREALKKRYEFWLSHLEDNSIWDWFGSSSLLVSGIYEKS